MRLGLADWESLRSTFQFPSFSSRISVSLGNLSFCMSSFCCLFCICQKCLALTFSYSPSPWFCYPGEDLGHRERVKWLITLLGNGTLGFWLKLCGLLHSGLMWQSRGTGNLRFRVVNSVLTWKMPLVLCWNRHADYVTVSNTFPAGGRFWLTFYGPHYSGKQH